MIARSAMQTVCVLVLSSLSWWDGLRAEDVTDRAATVAGEMSADEVIFEETVGTGFVFFGTEYLSAPYHIQATSSSVTVNGRLWPVVLPALAADNSAGTGDGEGGHRRFDRWSGRDQGSSGRTSRSGRSTPRRIASRIANNLADESVIVVLPGQSPEYFSRPSDQYGLFRALLNREPGSKDLQQFLSICPESEGRKSTWEEWVTGVAVTEELQMGAEPILEKVGAAEAKNFAEIRANHRLSSLAYPLTVLGMVLGILALGHLLKSFSRLDSQPEIALPPEALRATSVTIGLMVVLSLFDLTWTILASQAGQMRELNPLGSRLITDPSTLIAFKIAATLVGCGILFALRRHQRARHACWWLCLVCTVLTFRWVMFNSMFVA